MQSQTVGLPFSSGFTSLVQMMLYQIGGLAMYVAYQHRSTMWSMLKYPFFLSQHTHQNTRAENPSNKLCANRRRKATQLPLLPQFQPSIPFPSPSRSPPPSSSLPPSLLFPSPHPHSPTSLSSWIMPSSSLSHRTTFPATAMDPSKA